MMEQIKQTIQDYNDGKTANFSNKQFIQYLIYLIGEVERLTGDKEAAEISINAWEEHTEELRKALEWYADSENYRIQFLVEGANMTLTPTQVDRGQLARQALERSNP